MAADSGDTRTSLDGHGIFAIVVFAIVALICIQPVYVPVPHPIAEKAKALKKRLVGSSDDVPMANSNGGEHHEANQHQTTTNSTNHNSGQDSIQPPQATGVATEGFVEQTKTRSYIVLNHVWTPAIGILFLLATKTIGGEQVKLGIIGEQGVEPYDVLVFFISLAYIAISLDATGLLRYLAFQVCIKAGRSGMGLYLVLYAFFWTLGVLVGNDPVILSGTAFLVYLTRVAGITPPSAWIWAQFVAANISSAVLVSSNPTNLVIASGFNIKFTVYTAYMILPALVSAAFALGVLLLFFRNHTKPAAVAGKSHQGAVGRILQKTKASANAASLRRRVNANDATSETIRMKHISSSEQQKQSDQDVADGDEQNQPVGERQVIYIPKSIDRPDVDPRAALVDPKGAIFASFVMMATLITVIVTNVTGGAKVYMVAAPGAGVCLLRDIVYDWYTWRSFRKKEQAEQHDVMERAQKEEASAATNPDGAKEVKAQGTAAIGDSECGPAADKRPRSGTANQPLLAPVCRSLKLLSDMFPTVSYVFSRLPFPLLPFAFGMFILVQALQHVGFITIMAGGVGNVCAHGYVGCSFFVALLGVILCNLGGTNIGATILLTRALQSEAFQQRLPEEKSKLILRAASFSVAFGSNVGALGGTFAASLAGLLWRDGLRQRGVLVTKAQFAVWCAVVIVPATVSGVLILLPEVRYFGLA